MGIILIIPIPVLQIATCSDRERGSSHSTNTLASKSVRQCNGGRDKSGLREPSAWSGPPDYTGQGLGALQTWAHSALCAHGCSFWVVGKPCRVGLGASRAGQGSWKPSGSGGGVSQRIFVSWKMRQRSREWFLGVPREPVAAGTLFDYLVLPIPPMQCRRASDCWLLLDSRLGCVSGAQRMSKRSTGNTSCAAVWLFRLIGLFLAASGMHGLWGMGLHLKAVKLALY